MIPLLLLLSAARAGETAAAAVETAPVAGKAGSPKTIEVAVATELSRAQKSLKLTDAPSPYLFLYDVLDGEVTTQFAEGGALVSSDTSPYRSLRTEVRVGDYTTDSSNFFAFGEPDGVVSKMLPVENDLVALRREIWLATDAAYKFAVEQYSRKIAARRGDTSPRPPDFTPATPPPPTEPGAPSHPDEGLLKGLTQRLSAALSEHPGVTIGQAIAREWQGQRLVLTSEGVHRWSPTGFAVLRVEGTLELPDGSTLKDSRSWVVRSSAKFPDEAALQASVREMGDWLDGLRNAPVEDDYLGPVLFEGPASAELFSQLLAAEIVGTPPSEEDDGSVMDAGKDTPTARIGRRLFPDGWRVTDDVPGHPDAAGAYAVDQEGVTPRMVELVRDGVVRDLLMSRIPRKDLTGSTGHGRSLGNERRAAMPAVVTVTPARAVSDKKLRSTGIKLAAETGRPYLLVVRRLEPPALQENLDVSVSGEGPPAGLTQPYEVYRLYADGREEPVRSLRFSGVDRRVLRDIVLAGANTGPVDMLDGAPGPERFQIGPTGGIPVTWDTPPVLIAEMELVGNAGGEPRALVPPTGP